MDPDKNVFEPQRPYNGAVRETQGAEIPEDHDSGDMYRMGKTPQFKRIFHLSTMVMFTLMVQVTWEAVLIANNTGLVNGGLAGVFWGYIWTFFGFMLIAISLAEMASMAPTSGGQYHWVSEFAPRKYQRFLSYVSAGTAGGAFVVGTVIQAIIVAYDPSYSPKPWQGTLFVFAIAFTCGLVNVGFAPWLPQVQKVFVIPHGLAWMAVIVLLWVKSPHATAKDVFTNFTSNGGWQPIGVSVLVGQITSVWWLISSDGAAHLAEEVKNAGASVPNAIVWTLVVNGIVGLLVLVSFLFAIPDLNAVLDLKQNPSGFSFLYVFQHASYHGTLPLIILTTLCFLSGVVDFNAATSRQLFAFARDGGVPFASFVAKVHRETVPQNAVIITCAISALLSLINLGSTIAFNAIISLQLLSLMSTYCMSIGCLFYRRVTAGHSLPPAQWSMGKYSIWINGLALLYSFFVLFWVGWPQAREVTAATFNWSSVMFAAVFIFSMVYYLTWGRRTYFGPVVLVRSLNTS